MNRLKQSLKVVGKSPLTVVCFCFAGYFTVSQFLKFLENKDTSSIGFKTFESSTDPIFPSFSICLESNIIRSGNGDWLGILDQSLFQSTDGIQHHKYSSFLRGVNRIINMTWDYNHHLHDLSFENTSLQIFDFFTGYTFPKQAKTELITKRDEHGHLIRDYSKNPDSDIRPLPLYKSYQDLSRICISRRKDVVFQYLNEYEEIEMRLEALIKKLNKIGNTDIKVVIYLHHLGRLIRGGYKPVMESFVTSLGPLINVDVPLLFGKKKHVSTKWNNQFEIAIDDVRVVRMRSSNPSTKYKLDENNDDDFEFMRVAMTKVGCVPPYWKDFVQHAWLDNNTSSIRFGNCNS